MQPYAKLFSVASQGLPGNDSKHNKADLNAGGGPAFRNRKKVPGAIKGGFGQHGQQRYDKPSMGGGRGSSGNPGASPTIPGEARSGAMRPEQRVPGHGGSPQHRGGTSMTRQFGTQGQGAANAHAPGQLPSYGSADPKPTRGNVGGRMAKRVIGRFQQDSKGSKAGSMARAGGKWGGPPVRLDT